MCSAGLPLISLTLTASPSLRPRMPSWEIGFCSKNSLTKSCAYLRVRRYRVGRRSFSDMDCERSKTRMRCRMIPRCNGVVSLNSLRAIQYWLRERLGPIPPDSAHLFRFPASRSPSTVELIVPSTPSTRDSHVRETSHSAPPRCLFFLERVERPVGGRWATWNASTSSSSSVDPPMYSSSESDILPCR